MMIIIQGLIGTMLLLVMIYPFYWAYTFIRDSIRMFLFKKGHRVFTIREMQKLGLTAVVNEGIVEGTVVLNKDDGNQPKTFEADVIDEKELELRRRRKEEKEKLNYFEDPIKKFKNYDL